MKMKKLSEYHNEVYGNDCVIYTNIVLIESNEDYLVIIHEKIIGWSNDSNVSSSVFLDYNQANDYYNKLIENH